MRTMLRRHSVRTKPWMASVLSIALSGAVLTAPAATPTAAAVESDPCVSLGTVYPGVYEADFNNSWSSAINLYGEPDPGSAFATGHMQIDVTRVPAQGEQPATLQARTSFTITAGGGESEANEDGDPLSSWVYNDGPVSVSSLQVEEDWSPGSRIPVQEEPGGGIGWLQTVPVGDCLSFKVMGWNPNVAQQTWDIAWGPLAPNMTVHANAATAAEYEQRSSALKQQVDQLVASATSYDATRSALAALGALAQQATPCEGRRVVIRAMQTVLDGAVQDIDVVVAAGPFEGLAATFTRVYAEQPLVLWVDATAAAGPLNACLSSARVEQSVYSAIREFTKARNIEQALVLDKKATQCGFPGIIAEIAAELKKMAAEAFATLRSISGTATDEEYADAAQKAARLDEWSIQLGNETSGFFPWLAADVGRKAVVAFDTVRGIYGTAPEDQFTAAAERAIRLDKWSEQLGNPSCGAIDWLSARLCGGFLCNQRPAPAPVVAPAPAPAPAAVIVSQGLRRTLVIQVNQVSMGKVKKVTDYQVRARTAKRWKTLKDARSKSQLIRTKTRLTAGKTYQVQVRAVGRNVRGKKVSGPWSSSTRITISR